MSKKEKEVKLVKAIALHDLSYIDHEGNPQYRRQSSTKVFEIDEGNFNDFASRNAIALAEPTPAAPVVDEEDDDFADKNDGKKPLSLNKDSKK